LSIVNDLLIQLGGNVIFLSSIGIRDTAKITKLDELCLSNRLLRVLLWLLLVGLLSVFTGRRFDVAHRASEEGEPRLVRGVAAIIAIGHQLLGGFISLRLARSFIRESPGIRLLRLLLLRSGLVDTLRRLPHILASHVCTLGIRLRLELHRRSKVALRDRPRISRVQWLELLALCL
jgi:hypothetical protein